MVSKESTAGAFTPRDYELLAGALQCLKSELVVDYARFAEKCGLKNANSAKASWHGLKKKLDKQAAAGKAASADDGEDAVEEAEDEAPPKPNASRKRKAAATPAVEENEEAEAEVKPKTKKAKAAAIAREGKKSKRGAKEAEEKVKEEDEEA